MRGATIPPEPIILVFGGGQVVVWVGMGDVVLGGGNLFA